MKKIIMTEYDDYESDFKLGEHHYARIFAQNGYKVLWLNPIYNYLTYLKSKELYLKREVFNNEKFKEVEKNLFVYSPKSLFLYGNKPVFNTKLACKLSNKYILHNFKNQLIKNDFYDVDILWLSNPKYFYISNYINYKKLIHRCADNVTEAKNLSKSLRDFEKKIFKKSDKVFVTSKDIIKKRSNERKDLIYLPNGVELDNFIREKYKIPEEFKNIKKAKVVYVGAIKEWFNIDLIDYVSKKLKDVEFYFIGNIEIDISKLNQINNIHFLGKRNYKNVPNYMYFSDVGIIPFKINEFINGVSPIKLYEYMSVGLNVVSTNFRGIKILNSPAYLANTYDEFARYILKGIENKKTNKDLNINFAKDNTWNKRFNIIKENV